MIKKLILGAVISFSSYDVFACTISTAKVIAITTARNEVKKVSAADFNLAYAGEVNGKYSFLFHTEEGRSQIGSVVVDRFTCEPTTIGMSETEHFSIDFAD